MSREIKFRGLALQPSLWVYGLYFKSGSEGQWTEIQTENGATVYIDEKTIGQFTGLKDKNGKEIYEGDIVRVEIPVISVNEDFIGRVEMLEGRWWIDNGSDAIPLWSEANEITVLGNVFENLELLEALT